MFEFASFVNRNPMYAVKNWRSLSTVRKAILNHREQNAHCAFCGRKSNLQVHHKVPVWSSPEQAAEPNNLVTLCQPHHLYVGHNGDYSRRYCETIDSVCRVNLVAIKTQ